MRAEVSCRQDRWYGEQVVSLVPAVISGVRRTRHNCHGCQARAATPRALSMTSTVCWAMDSSSSVGITSTCTGAAQGWEVDGRGSAAAGGSGSGEDERQAWQPGSLPASSNRLYTHH